MLNTAQINAVGNHSMIVVVFLMHHHSFNACSGQGTVRKCYMNWISVLSCMGESTRISTGKCKSFISVCSRHFTRTNAGGSMVHCCTDEREQ